VITWYFDLVSPFAYLALPRVEVLATRHALAMRPIVFGAVLKHWGQLGPAEIAPKRLHTYRLCQFLANQAGLQFRFPPSHPFRSLEAMRLLAACDGEPGAVRTAFDFGWSEGRDLSDPAELASLAARLGARPEDGRDRLRSWTEAAIAAGVFGVPSLVVDGTVFWGHDALPMAEAAIADPAFLTQGEMARFATLPVGIERR